ncbi:MULTISPECIES: TonB-dependent receptor [Pseudoalteromonas]|uniref:TonB-dependent receptor n=1 Tax=Pseudoalteromonas amylolytica TaxID=1859457 RepID=A0A1S1MV89_9GAMM|nr:MULTISPECIES: TonB-dependent receptor [Pseudoalteromonas]OHU86587.1 TonB-dependent receptor [Pseudoalteromonas sp. JW3]OHU88888.1 TonB-dependent receptor [Pseudoalteromonas amylolytica]
MLANNFKKSLLAVNVGLVLSASVSGMAYAADENQVKEDVEVIEVRGLRASNKANINAKRFSNAVVDAVTAEDIGKFPDSDVGQALGRVPGITVGRSFGQGGSVSIRGTDPRMTLTTLNGQNVASTGWYDQLNIDRSFNYSMLPAELIGGMEVYKSTQANIVEGGIGGTVIVKTRKPLDLEANTIFASAKGEYGSLNENVAPDLSALYSWKNEDETFGILVSGAYVDREYLRQGTEADLDWGLRSSIQPSSFLQDQERTAIDATLQYRPNDRFEVGAHVMTLELGADSIGANMYINTDTDWGEGDSFCQKFNGAGVCTLSVTPEEQASRIFFQNWARKGEMTSDTFELNAKYEGDGYVISAVAGNTKAEGGTQMSANFGYGWWGDKFHEVKWAGTVDAQGKQIKVNGRDMGFTRDQLDSTVGTSTWTGIKGPNSDEETYAQIDLDLDLDLGAINKFEAGIRVTDHEFVKSEYRAVYVDDVADRNVFNTEDLYSGTMPLGYDGWTIPKANLDAMINSTISLVDEFVYSRPAYGKIEEDNFSAYAMFGFDSDGIRGNFGVRYISTDVTSSGHVIDNTPADNLAVNAGWSSAVKSVEGEYSDVLPSVNVSFDLSPDMILRFSAGQAITRPNYDTLFLSSSSGYPDDRDFNEQITYGNPALKPMKSSQADLSLEYYYGDGNLVSATYFIKDISNFIVATTQFDQQIGVINNDIPEPADTWTVNNYKNAGGGEIEGIEFQINHAFDNGFGVNANYTYTDAAAPAEVYTDNLSLFTESSKHSANLVGYWENDEFSARAAYNWRSEYMIREYGYYYGNRMHDDFGTLDVTLGWNATENITATLEIVNLTEEDDVQYGAAGVNSDVKAALKDNFPTWSFRGETTYKLGVSFRY